MQKFCQQGFIWIVTTQDFVPRLMTHVLTLYGVANSFAVM